MKMLEVEARRVYLTLLLKPTSDEVAEQLDCEITLGMIMTSPQERAAAARRCETRALARETAASHELPLPSMLSDSFFQPMHAAAVRMRDHGVPTNLDETSDTNATLPEAQDPHQPLCSARNSPEGPPQPRSWPIHEPTYVQLPSARRKKL